MEYLKRSIMSLRGLRFSDGWSEPRLDQSTWLRNLLAMFLTLTLSGLSDGFYHNCVKCALAVAFVMSGKGAGGKIWNDSKLLRP